MIECSDSSEIKDYYVSCNVGPNITRINKYRIPIIQRNHA